MRQVTSLMVRMPVLLRIRGEGGTIRAVLVRRMRMVRH
jgi:hypothetical protein